MAVYGYVRVSTETQATEGEGLDVQRRQIEGWCHMRGLPLDQVVTEAGVSGSIHLRDRPKGGLLLDVLRPGDTLIAPKLDRLFRSALDALQMVEWFKERQVSLVLIDLGGDVATSGLSKLFLTIAAAFAEAERDRIRERIAQAKRDQKSRGRYLGGKVPFGFEVNYDGKLKPKADEQAIIDRILELRDAGASLRTIRAALIEEKQRALSIDAIGRIVREARAARPAGPQLDGVVQ
ncbi:recombinase family protein [Azospirillum sp. sgz302134]